MPLSKKKLLEWVEKAVEFSKSGDPDTYGWLVEQAEKDNIYCGHGRGVVDENAWRNVSDAC